ncbi:MAG: PAS domain-containing protein, partial [Syntrophomonadaceae bacterium]|nr:PAS domain-containing protein [Syntrophomonadaceae bacterium]
MRKLKETIQLYLFSEQFSLESRMLNMICMVGILAAIAATISRIVMKQSPTMIIVMLFITFAVFLALFINIRFNFSSIITLSIIFILGNILFPAALFMLGGSYSGMAAYFVISIAIIFFFSNGATRVIMLTVHIVWVTFCYFLTWRFSHWVIIPKLDLFQQTLDNIQSFIISGFFVGLVIAFQNTIYQTEKRKVEYAMQSLETVQKTVATIFESNPHINVMFDSGFRLIDCNPAAIEFLGFTSKEETLSSFEKLMSESIPESQPNGTPFISLNQRLKTTIQEGAVSFQTELHIPSGVKILDVEMKRVSYDNSFVIVCYLVDLTTIHEARNNLI